jgi:hypothetical protein
MRANVVPRSAMRSPNENPLPPSASSSSVKRPIASLGAWAESTVSAALTKKSFVQTSRPRSVVPGQGCDPPPVSLVHHLPHEMLQSRMAPGECPEREGRPGYPARRLRHRFATDCSRARVKANSTAAPKRRSPGGNRGGALHQILDVRPYRQPHGFVRALAPNEAGQQARREIHVG